MADVEELRRIVQVFVRRFGALSEDRTPCGQPLPASHAHALMRLLEHPEEAPTQSELARALALDKSSAARLCARMMEAGHVIREPCREDGRAFRLRLTPAGLRAAQRVEAASRARFEQIVAALPEGAERHVIEALRLLHAAVEAAEEKKE